MPLTKVTGDNIDNSNFSIGITTATNITATNITGTNLNISGVGSITTLSGTTLTYPTANITVGLVTNITGTNINYTGVSTFTNATGTNLNISGVSTHLSTTLIGSGTSTGTASQTLQVTGGGYISGALGIGTTNPGKAFMVFGTGGNYISEFYNTNNASNNNGVYIHTQNTATATQPLNVQGNVIVNGAGNLLLGTGTDTGTANQPLQVSGGAYVSGNLGVGTITTYGDGNASFTAISVGGNGTRYGLLEIKQSNAVAGAWIDCYGNNGSGDLRITTAGTSNSIQFWTGGAFTEKMRITSGGNVGIGLTNPTAVLHVSSNDFVRITRNSKDLTINANYSALNQKAQLQTDTGMDLAFATNGDNERARIDSSGNLGIGITNPGAKLDVTGNIRLSAANPNIEFNNGGAMVYSPTGNTLAFASGGGPGAPAEKIRIDNLGNLKLSTAGTTIQNSSGRPILNQTGSILQVSWKDLGGGNWSATTTSSTYSTVTGYTNTITPSSTSSKILHIVCIGAYMVCDGNVAIGRGGSVISPSLLDSYRDVSGSNYMNDMPPFTFTWLDSPATTSAITYQLYARATGCGGYMFIGSSSDFDASWTMLEVAG